MSEELDMRAKEVASLAAAIAGSCGKCFKYHYAQAIKIGITKDEIKEIIQIAKDIKNRPIEDVYKLADQLLEDVVEG